MKKNIFIVSCLMLLVSSTIGAQEQNDEQAAKYRRSSIYSMLVRHTEKKFGNEIMEEYLKLPVPDKYDNHNLNVRLVETTDEKQQEEEITRFLEKNQVAKRLVAKWFERNKETGVCDMKLISERGQYNATDLDVRLARKTARGVATLSDAGEELISHTFIMVNDIRYVDKENTSKAFGMGIRLLGSVATIATGVNFADMGENAAALAESIKGFKVIVNSYLYKLEWNDDVANKFYTQYYLDGPDKVKAEEFLKDNGTFKLKFIGKQSVRSNKTTMSSNYEPADMIRKVVCRALDESVLELQRSFDVFKVKTPLYGVNGKEVYAQVGLKEGVSQESKYEVLEKNLDESTGKTTYKRVGVIEPVSGKIWDNRYMAAEDQTLNSKLKYTTFKKVSGSDFFEGMLIREIK